MSPGAVVRTGVFGGTFDPVHNGHLIGAQCACEALDLGHVLWMPAPSAPLRDRPAGAAAVDRLALVRLAIAGEPRFSVSALEFERPGPSYAWETAEALLAAGERDLVWLIGADQLARLPRWHRIEDLAAQVSFGVFPRPGFALETPAGLPSLRWRPVPCPQLEISSTEIRRRLALGLTVRHWVPDAVHDFLRNHRLYRRPATPSVPTAITESLRSCCQVLDDKKAEDLRVFDVSQHSSITNFLVLATGTSEPHLRALRSELEKRLAAEQIRVVGADGETGSGWTVIDGFDFMVHLFTRQTREHYRLEHLWGDGTEVVLARVLAPPTPEAPPARRPTRRRPKAEAEAPPVAGVASARRAKSRPRSAQPKVDPPIPARPARAAAKVAPRRKDAGAATTRPAKGTKGPSRPPGRSTRPPSGP